jgi:hypothetical protein
MYLINEDELYNKIVKMIEYTEYIKNAPDIENLIVGLAKRQSSLFIFATDYIENDMKIGLFQMSINNLRSFNFADEICEMFDVNRQIIYVLTYLDYLYSRFSEVRNPRERVKIIFLAYKYGIGAVNKALKIGREQEEINYEGDNTLQGKWSTYENVLKILEKEEIK